MKTFRDYLKEKGKWTKEFANVNYAAGESNSFTIVVELTATDCIITYNGKEVCFPATMDVSDLLQEFLYYKHKMEIRFCEECGVPYDKGFIAGDGDWYCCENCFEIAMDDCYGKDKWRPSKEEGSYGGWYEYLDDDGKWKDTSVYYTEWND